MKIAALTVSVSLLCAMAAPIAFAQSAAPTAAGAKAQRQTCRESINSQNLADADKKAKMKSCMAPARENCRKQAAEQNVAKGTPRKDFMKKCLTT